MVNPANFTAQMKGGEGQNKVGPINFPPPFLKKNDEKRCTFLGNQQVASTKNHLKYHSNLLFDE